MVQIATKLNWYGQQVVAQVSGAAYEGLMSAGEYLRSEAVPETPVDTHVLRESCEVSGDDKSQVVVSYDTPYAVVQHERTDYNHPNGGKAKYLEDPFNRERDVMLNIVAQKIRGELG